MSQGRYVSGELVRSVYVVNMSSGGGSGTPGGSNTQIQFNNAGVFGGVANSSVNNATGNITLGNRVSVPLGTAALPSIYPGTDTNTGIYSPGADQLAVATNGTGRLFINATGNVGIGTTSPVAPLQVNKNSTNAAAGAITIKTADSNESFLTFGVSTSLGKATITSSENGAGAVLPIAFTVGSSSTDERMRIDTSGRLLVGTSTALSNFSYEATSTLSPQIQLIGSTASTAHLGIVRTSGNGASYLTLGWGSDGNVAASNQYIGVLLFSAFDGSVYRNAAYIQCEADGAHAAGDTPGRLLFSTTADGASSPTERLRIDSSGNVGIGTTDPADELHINASSANVNLRLTRDTDTGVRITGTDSTSPAFIIETISSGTATERARIDSSGRLLVGTSTSIAVGGANGSNIQLAGSAALQSQSRWVANTGGPSFILGKSRSATPGSYTIVQDDDGLGTITFAGDDGTDLQSVAARIQGFVDGTPGADDMPGRLVFSTTADGANSPTERLHINSVGQTMVNSAGTAAAPVISKVDDTNTGIFFPAADTIAFAEGGVERARIDSDGRLLLGTSASIGYDNNLQLVGSTADASAATFWRSSSDQGNPSINFVKTRGSVASQNIVSSGDGLGNIRFNGHDGTDHNNGAAEIRCFVDGIPGTDDMPGRLVFSTTSDGANSPTERMRITSDAYVRLAAGTGGIQFNGDTAAANALDDYEDGTWTPIFVPQTGSFNSITYDSTRAGNYTKVGNLVTVWGIIRTDSVDATGASGLLAIGGLPFSVGTGTTGGGFAVNLLNWAGEYPSSVRPSVGETFAYLGYRTAIDGNDTISNVSDLTTGTGDANRLAFQFSYRV
jgi:hypothetical protein